MAKTTGPLLSFDASGTVGKTMTCSKWKGRTYSRLRVIPKNPMSADQGETRSVFGGIGKFNKAVEKDSDFYTQLLAVTPADQSQASYFAKQAAAAWGDAKDAYALVGNATVKGYFDTAAGVAGLADFKMSYDITDGAPAGLILWTAALVAYRLGLAIAPVLPEDMTQQQVTDFGAALKV